MSNLSKKIRDEKDKKRLKKLTGKTPKHRCPVCHRFSLWSDNGKVRVCLMCEILKKEREEYERTKQA